MKVKALLGAAIAVISLNALAMDTDTNAATDNTAPQTTQPKAHKHKHKHHVNKKKAKEAQKVTADNSSIENNPATNPLAAADANNDVSTN